MGTLFEEDWIGGKVLVTLQPNGGTPSDRGRLVRMVPRAGIPPAPSASAQQGKGKK